MTPLALAAPVADAAPPAWQGVWAGTIGALPVRACLERRRADDAVGLYLYRSRLQLIKLEQQGGGKLWLEGFASQDSRPQWRFDAVGRGLLTGSWSDGEHRLPFRLTPVPTEAEVEPCSSLAFHAPRLRPLKVRTRRAVIGGAPYVRLTFDPGPALDEVKLESFALAGGDAATGRINVRLRRSIQLQPAGSDWWECISGGFASAGMGGDYQAVTTPTLITARWLAATSSADSFCGGAHPNSSATSMLFDRTTGAEVALEEWLNAAGVERHRDGERGYVTIRPALRRMVMRHASAIEADCRGPVNEEEFWDIGLAREGLRFTPLLAHVVQACAHATVVPWAALTPFLNDAGRAGRASLSGR